MIATLELCISPSNLAMNKFKGKSNDIKTRKITVV